MFATERTNRRETWRGLFNYSTAAGFAQYMACARDDIRSIRKIFSPNEKLTHHMELNEVRSEGHTLLHKRRRLNQD